MTTCGGVEIVCLAIWMVFHHSQTSLTAGQKKKCWHELWVASAEVDSWKVKFTLVQGPLHSKYSPHVLMKALKTYGKFQKNMDLVLRKPLEEIFDIQIWGINFDSSEIIHPSPLFQVYTDCRLLQVLGLLKKPQTNCFLETLLWT